MEVLLEPWSQDWELTELEGVFLGPIDLSPISSNQQEDFKEFEDHSWLYEMNHGRRDVVAEVTLADRRRSPRYRRRPRQSRRP